MLSPPLSFHGEVRHGGGEAVLAGPRSASVTYVLGFLCDEETGRTHLSPPAMMQRAMRMPGARSARARRVDRGDAHVCCSRKKREQI